MGARRRRGGNAAALGHRVRSSAVRVAVRRPFTNHDLS
jgi:hypothetical protein